MSRSSRKGSANATKLTPAVPIDLATWRTASAVLALLNQGDALLRALEADIDVWSRNNIDGLGLDYAWVRVRGRHLLYYFANNVQSTPPAWSASISAIVHSYRNAYEIVEASKRRTLIAAPKTWPPRSQDVQLLEQFDNQAKHEALPLTASALIGTQIHVLLRNGREVGPLLPSIVMAPTEAGDLVAEFDITSTGGQNAINFVRLVSALTIGLRLPPADSRPRVTDAIGCMRSFATTVRADLTPWLEWLDDHPEKPAHPGTPPFTIAGGVTVARNPRQMGASFFRRA